MRALLISLSVFLLAAGAIGWGGWTEYQGYVNQPIAVAEGQDQFEIPPGTNLRTLARRLVDQGWAPNPYVFIALAYRQGQQRAIKAGEYAVPDRILPKDLLALFASGRSIQFPVTLIEGRTFREALAAVAAAGPFRIELAGLPDQEIMQRLGIEGDHPEGWLFPDTYLFPRGTSDTRILRRAHARMRQVLAEEWTSRAEGLPLETPYQALILASLIEKETAVPAERPAIAGVFTRRLRQGMRLQTDPTVIYGLGDAFDGNLRRADLVRPSPYNTYLIEGLPPTPIALPGRAAIHAALHPAPGDALYFVARKDGSHHFSATLDEHNCAVQHYQLNRPCARLKEQAPVAAPAPDTGAAAAPAAAGGPS